jgi:stage IV sporulation protein FB
MILGEPAPTPIDINFSVMGVPVRIHPLFFVGVLILSGTTDLVHLVIFGAAVFISILVHELGHVMAFMHYGIRARVVLLFLGGLAIPDQGGRGGIWSNFGGYSKSVNQAKGWSEVVIASAGPIAGFALAAVIVLGAFVAGGHVRFAPIHPLHFWEVTLPPTAPLNLLLFVDNMLFCNIIWGLLNCLPILPLDGGRVSRQLFLMADPWKGITNSLWLSVAAAGAVALWMMMERNGMGAIWFGILGYGAFQQLQFSGRGGRPW